MDEPAGGNGQAGVLGRIALLRPLRRREFALLWTAMSVSMLGDGLYFVSIAWLAYEDWGGAGALAAFGVTLTAAQVIWLLPAGALSDRVERRRVMIGADLVRLVGIGGIGVLTLTDRAELWHLLVLIGLYGTGEAFFFPSFQALVPQVVPDDELMQANAIDSFVRPLALQLAGPAIGGIVVGALGVGPAILFDAATFVFSAIVLLGLPRYALPPRVEAPGGASLFRDLWDGLQWVRHQRWILACLIWASAFLLVFLGPFQVLVPGLVKDDLLEGATQLGLVLAAGGAGSVVASVVVAQRGMPARHALTIMYVEWLLALSTAALMGVVQAVWQAMLVSFFVGGLFAAGNLIWSTLRQQLVPGELQGRVASIDWFASASLVPLSFALAAPAGAAIGVRATLSAGALMGAALTVAMLVLPGVRTARVTPTAATGAQPASAPTT